MGALKAGFAKALINPPLDGSVALAGYGMQPERTAQAVLDDLCVRVLALDDGYRKAVLVSVDTILISASLALNIRKRIEKEAGLPAGAILISATHTHSAPATDFLRHWGALSPAYNLQIERATGDAIQAALRDLQPAAIGIGEAQVEGLAFNRVRQAGPVDHTLRILGIRSAESKQLRIAAGNFACHPVHMPTDSRFVSADFPGRFVRDLERDRPGCQALFLQGAPGDINPTGVFGGVDAAQNTGRALAESARSVLEGLPFSSDGEISFHQAECDLPLDWATARKEASDYLFKGLVRETHRGIAQGGLMREWAVETLGLAAANPPETLRCEVHALRCGDAAFVGLPGEMYTFIAQKIRTASHFKHTWVLGYANGSVGYVTDPGDYDEKAELSQGAGGGSYAATLAPKIFGLPQFKPHTWEAVVDAATRALKAL